MYLRGISAYETQADNVPLLDRVAQAIYSPFEVVFAWFVLDRYPLRPPLIIGRDRNVEKNIKDAYSWLAETYRKGDRIYLFGAFQARRWVWQMARCLQGSLEAHIKYEAWLV